MPPYTAYTTSTAALTVLIVVAASIPLTDVRLLAWTRVPAHANRTCKQTSNCVNIEAIHSILGQMVSQIVDTMSPIETVADSTDPGTLRPNIELETTTGDYFEPLFCPEFEHRTNLPPGLKKDDVFGIWSLFFTRELVELIVLYTNIKGRTREPVPSLSCRPATTPGLFAQEWIDVTIHEMYTYFGILICMALNLIKDIEVYWSRTRAHFKFMVEAMTCN